MKAINFKLFFAALGLSLSVFVLDNFHLLDSVKSVGQAAALPVQFGLYNAFKGLGETFSIITFWRSGESRIKNLELRVAELAGAAAQKEALERENEILRRQLGVPALVKYKLLPAAVLGKSRFLEINAGYINGVKEGQSVIFQDNFVGKIARTTPRASFVLLPTDPDSKIPARVGKITALVIGQFNSNMLLTRVAQDEEIFPEQLVVTSGEGESAAAGLLIGKIKTVRGGQTDLFKEAELTSFLDATKLSTVFVILDQ